MTDPLRTKDFHKKAAQSFLLETQSTLKAASGKAQLFRELVNKRLSVFNSEISKNPRGQILEPGFRVIFPVPNFN